MDAAVSVVAEHDDEDPQEAWERLTRRRTESAVTLRTLRDYLPLSLHRSST